MSTAVLLKEIGTLGLQVYTQPPKKSNRGQKIEKSPIHLLAETLSLKVRTPEQLKDNKFGIGLKTFLYQKNKTHILLCMKKLKIIK